jgi:hypothetical protein
MSNPNNPNPSATPPPDPDAVRQGDNGGILQPFTVECGDDKARTICLDHMRMHLRGRWSRSFFPGRGLGILNNMPDIPGMYINLNPRQRKLVISDPLSENKRLLDDINKVATGDGGFQLKSMFANWSPRESMVHEKLDEDLVVSLMIEIATKVYGSSPCMLKVPGSEPPTLKQIEAAQKSGKLPGRELYDPWSNSQDKPRYKEDAKMAKDAWTRLGILGSIAGQGAA